MGDEESNDKADANRAAGKTSYPYLKNFLGFKVDDESLKAIPYAQAEVYTHAMLKGCQILSVVGAVAGVACKAISYRNMRSHTIRLGLYSGARYGMLLGVPVGVAATWFRMHHVEQLKQTAGESFDRDQEYYYRAYKLRNNKGQLIADRLAVGGSLVGLASVCTKSYLLTEAASVGFTAGSIVAACRSLLINRVYTEKVNQSETGDE